MLFTLLGDFFKIRLVSFRRSDSVKLLSLAEESIPLADGYRSWFEAIVGVFRRLDFNVLLEMIDSSGLSR